jgi:hypothetical protein
MRNILYLKKNVTHGEEAMARKLLLVFALSSGLLLAAAPECLALSPETEQLLELLQQKGVITRQDSDEFRRTLEKGAPQAQGEERQHRHSVQSLDERMEKIEKAMDTVPSTDSRVQLSGFVEVELSAENADFEDGTDETSSDVALAKAELDVDVDITENIFGHIAFLYEDGEDVTVDEAIIGVNGPEKFPFSFSAGKMYVPFGWYESHFVSDPATLTMGETNEGALQLGYAHDMFDISIAVFNGEIREIDDDNMIDDFVASAAYTMPETGGFAMTAGISYTSNLGASDTLKDVGSDEGLTSEEVDDVVSALGTFINASFRERIFLYAEFVTALEHFSAGELAFDEGIRRQLSTWNIELAYALNPKVEIAARYGGSNEYGMAIPEDQFGVALLYSPFDNVSMVGEYLHSDFVDHSEIDSGAIQLAIEF